MRIALIPERGMESEVYTALGGYIQSRTGASVDYFLNREDALSNNGNRSLLNTSYAGVVTGARSGLDVVWKMRHSDNPNHETPVFVLADREHRVYSLLMKTFMRNGDRSITYPVNNKVKMKSFFDALPKSDVLNR
ncbi:MAG: hypothetical protein JW716_05065 [Candidatus Aenigmarchaeota archaeon]|nr:hypothetical protein [Candidatus Aenigmarchaeota archaeon]